MQRRGTIPTPTSREATPPRVLFELIGSIYDCALEPERWDETLVAIKDALDCHSAMLSLNDVRNNRLLIGKSVGVEWTASASEHLPEVHARLGEFFAARPSLDEPFVLLRELSNSYLDTSPYYRQSVRPTGIIDFMQYFLMHTPERFAGFGVGRHERRGPITEREIELGGLLLPHIRRAVTISNVLDARTIERARMAEALDALKCGVVLTNADGAILHANRAAEDMLRKGDPIQGGGGVLTTKEPGAAKELRSAIRLAAHDEASIGKVGLAVCLTEPDAAPICAHVLPMAGGEFRARLQPAAVAAVFVGAPETHDGADTMASMFGLTRAETAVLRGLVSGLTLSETAESLGVALSTAKAHLESIFAKTGVARQADLILLAGRFASPAGPGK
jgi:DNA-binding CsgD family transcriptional regulator/PAS domain-containing protein